MSNVNMVTQFSEEKTPISYTPFFFGNQAFVMARQNTRKIENIASFSFGVLMQFGEVIPIDPSLHSVLFNQLMSQVGQQANNQNVIPLIGGNTAQASPTLFSFETKNTACEKMDTSPFHFTCSKSTSSTELTSQNVDLSSRSSCRHCGNKKYILLDLSKPNEVLKINADECCENCLKLNAREEQKQRKIRFDESFA